MANTVIQLKKASASGSVPISLANGELGLDHFTGNLWFKAANADYKLINPASGGAGTPGGSSPQIQFNNAGAFGGFTMSGDFTVITSTGVGTISTNAVTYPKFQQVAAYSIVGNPTVSLANTQAISMGATLVFSGTALQTVAMTGDVTTGGNSFGTTIAPAVVTNAKLANEVFNRQLAMAILRV